MNERNHRDRRENVTDISYDDSVALITELTGLIPSPPGDWDEAVSFTELAGIPTQSPEKRRRNNAQNQQNVSE